MNYWMVQLVEDERFPCPGYNYVVTDAETPEQAISKLMVSLDADDRAGIEFRLAEGRSKLQAEQQWFRNDVMNVN